MLRIALATARRTPVARLSRAWFHKSAYFMDSESPITPWYVTEARKTEQQSEKHSSPLPDLPPNAPAELEGIVRYAAEEMGLKDVVIIDKRSKDDVSGAVGPSLLVLGTGASPRHLGTAGALLQTHLKSEYGIHSGREGVLTTNFVKLHNRRQKRRQQRQRMASGANSSSLARVGTWVAIDTKIDNIYVHLMTPERRDEVDLEHLDEYLDEFEAEETNEIADTEYFDPVGISSSSSSSSSSPSSVGGKRSFHTSARIFQDSIPENREELALENLDAERRSDLSLQSPEVVNFLKHFPELPTREDWKVRLRFFSLCAINSPSFPLSKVVEEAEQQQISGFPLDAEDIEEVMASICYHGQSQFTTVVRDDEATAAWRELCDLKAQLLHKFYTVALEPAERSLLGNQRLLTLLYRTFTCPTADSTTPAAALQFNEVGASEEEEVKELDAFYDLARLTPVRYILESTNELQDIETVAMLLSSLANARLTSPFWKVAEGALLHANTRQFSSQLAELVVGLAVKSSDPKQIEYAIATYLPQKVLNDGVKLTPNLVAAVRSGLNIVDREGLEYKSVRKVLEAH